MDFDASSRDQKLKSTLSLLKIGEELKLDCTTYYRVSEAKAFEICEKILKKHLEKNKPIKKKPQPPPFIKGSKYSYLKKSQIEKTPQLQEEIEASILEEDFKKIEAFQFKKLLCPLCSKTVYIELEEASFCACDGCNWLDTICSDLQCGIYSKYYYSSKD